MAQSLCRDRSSLWADRRAFLPANQFTIRNAAQASFNNCNKQRAENVISQFFLHISPEKKFYDRVNNFNNSSFKYEEY